jgi:hypothetical protein
MWTLCFLLCSLFLATNATAADLFTCPDGRGGIFLQDQPCPGSPTLSSPVPPANTWEMLTKTDALTDRFSCGLYSVAKLMTVHRLHRVATIRIMVAMTPTMGPLVALLSTPVEGGVPFHTDIHGLGMRVDTAPFAPITLPGNKTILAFAPEQSQALLTALQTGIEAKIRVRFWPYDFTYDEVIPVTGFAEGFAALKRCEARGN